jgi:site-specific recombinase XerD
VEALGDLNHHHLEDWQDDMLSRKAPPTQSVATTAVRELLRWASRQDLPLTPSLWLSLEHRRKPRLLPKPIPLTQLQIVLAAFDKPDEDLTRLCARALFWLLYSSGARISEALSLDRDSFQDRSAEVIQKGGSPHTLMISAKAEAALQDYLEARTDSCRALFAFHGPGRLWLATLSLHPRPLPPPTRLRIKGAQRGWNGLCTELGIKRFTSHQVRHSCATTMLRHGINALVIAKHLGHADLDSISGYAEVEEASRRGALEVLDGGLMAS